MFNLPTGYNPPSVLVETNTEFTQPVVYGNSKILAIVGVSDETKFASSVEVIRGSSSALDNPIFGEDQSEQFLASATGAYVPTYTFSVDHFPIVDGTGRGRVTKDPTSVTVYVNGDIANVVSIDGALGKITLQTPPFPGDQVTVDYFFKKTDTYIASEDLSFVIPSAAKVNAFTLFAPASPTDIPATLALALSNPGTAGNYIDASNGVAISFKAVGSPDSGAISGNGTNHLTIDIKKDATVYRTAAELAALINTLAFSKTGGSIIATLTGNGVCDDSLAGQTFNFEGGAGQASATMFQVKHLPIVDGSNGGVPTTTATDIEVFVNNIKTSVVSVNGSKGLFTLATPVAEGSSLKVNYYTNTYRDTFDELPNKDILSVSQCGYSPKGVDFIPDANFVLDQDTINWGTAVKSYPLSTSNEATPFGSNVITTELVDDSIYLAQASGVCDGQNITFSLAATPVDGTGKSVISDDPSSITVYVGPDPVAALMLGPVKVIRLTGSLGQFMLQQPPAANQKVFATYFESRVSDLAYTLTSVLSGPAGVGTFSAVASTGPVPSFKISGTLSGNFLLHQATGGVVFPHGESDIMGIPGATPSERITLTFVDSKHFKVTSSRTVAQAKIDGMGITGGVTTPTDSTLGSVGADGYLNQTFVDSTTGVRFTILDASASYLLSDYGYTELVQSPYSFKAGDQLFIDSSLSSSFSTGVSSLYKFIPGVRMIVKNTMNIPTGDQAQVRTYAKSGDEPSVGDVYYVSYTYAKPETGYDLQVYYSSQEANVYQDYGYPSATNKLALAAWLAFRNGADVIGLLQIKKSSGSTDASDSAYVSALTKLQTLYPGLSRKPQILSPLNCSSSFIPYLKKHVESQSSIKMRGECVGFFGFANNTNPSVVISTCSAIASERMVGVYPDGGIITLSDNFGNTKDIVVDGSMVAVAVAALYADPKWDTATPRTRKPITGFKRLFRRLDPNVQNSVAEAGCTLIEQVGSAFRVRHALTTDPGDVLSIQPSITFLKDEIQQDIRDLLDPFVGKKFTNNVITDMNHSLVAYFKAKIDSEYIQTFSDVAVVRDTSDPRIARVCAAYVPYGELTYVLVDLTIKSKAN